MTLISLLMRMEMQGVREADGMSQLEWAGNIDGRVSGFYLPTGR